MGRPVRGRSSSFVVYEVGRAGCDCSVYANAFDVVCTSYGQLAVSEEVVLGSMKGMEKGVSRAATAISYVGICWVHGPSSSRIACGLRRFLALVRQRLHTS